MTEDWLITVALALTMTIILAAPMNLNVIFFFGRLRPIACKFETESVLPEDERPDLGDVKIAVIGMGQLGRSAYYQLEPDYENLLIGTDRDPEIVATRKAAGRNVICADPTDDDMWERMRTTDSHSIPLRVT